MGSILSLDRIVLPKKIAKKIESPELPGDPAIWAILESTSAETGQKYFEGLVQTLARLLNASGAWVTEFHEEERRLKALAFWMDGKWIENYETSIVGIPCEEVIHKADLVHFPERLLELIPHAEDAHALGVVARGVDDHGELRGDPGAVDRERILRPREGRVHRRDIEA